MPLVARTGDGRRITIFDALKSKYDYNYFCPICGAEMHVVRAKVRVPHFRHRPETSCKISESVKHLTMKAVVGQWLRSRGWVVDFEVPLGKRIADVVAEKDGRKIIVEVQHSRIYVEEFALRVAKDRKLGYESLWFFDAGSKHLVSLVHKLREDGFNAYLLDVETETPKVLLGDKTVLLSELDVNGSERNTVALVELGRVLDVQKDTDFCPRCFYTGEMVEEIVIDMADGSEVVDIYKMCPMCGFKF